MFRTSLRTDRSIETSIPETGDVLRAVRDPKNLQEVGIGSNNLGRVPEDNTSLFPFSCGRINLSVFDCLRPHQMDKGQARDQRGLAVLPCDGKDSPSNLAAPSPLLRAIDISDKVLLKFIQSEGLPLPLA